MKHLAKKMIVLALLDSVSDNFWNAVTAIDFLQNREYTVGSYRFWLYVLLDKDEWVNPNQLMKSIDFIKNVDLSE